MIILGINFSNSFLKTIIIRLKEMYLLLEEKKLRLWLSRTCGDKKSLYSHFASEQEYLIIRGIRQGAGGRREEKSEKIRLFSF